MSNMTLYRLVWGLIIASLLYAGVVILHSSRQSAQARQQMQGQNNPGHAGKVDRFIEHTSETLGR
jgi:hypothetical protein